MSDDIVRKYIERVEKLRQRNESRVSREDLEEIAREVGLSDADLAAVDEHVQAHYERGDGYVDHGLWDDAIAEFEEAFALAPTRVHVVYALANAHYGKAQATDSQEDRERALELTKECLELDSQYQPAFTLLSQIRSLEIDPATPTPSGTAPQETKKPVIAVAFGAAVVLVIGAMVPFMMLVSDEPASSRSGSQTAQPPVVKEVLSPKPSGKAFRIGESVGKTVEAVASPQGESLLLNVTKSEHNVYDDKAYFSMHALLKNESDREFEEIKAEMKLVSTAGVALQTEVVELHGSHDASLRPGDWTPYSTTISAPREFDRILVKIVSTDARQALEYAEEKIIEPTYVAQVPDNIELEIRERSSGTSSADYFQAEWAFENVGKGYIRTLRVESIIYGLGGEELGRRDWLIAYSGSPQIEPGQIWPDSTIQKANEPVDRYELRILKIQ